MDKQLAIGRRVLEYSVYGDPEGAPVIFHGGTPSTRWRQPDAIRAVEESGVRMVMPDRPGYGGSTRQPGRTVAAVVEDMTALADALGWERFAVRGRRRIRRGTTRVRLRGVGAHPGHPLCGQREHRTPAGGRT